MEPKVSVIVPVYNVLPYLREALDSVVNQSYRNLEILIIDDGSTDGSGAVCDEYSSDPRVRVIHQENRGLSGARNSGLDVMTGDYVAFLDSDDAFRPDMIRQMVQAAKRDGAEIVVCGYERIRTEGVLEEGKALETILQLPDALLPHDEAMRRLIVDELSYGVWNKLFACRLWKAIQFLEGHVYEDMHIICKVFDQCFQCRLLSERLYLYRSRPGSIVRTHTLKNYLDLTLAFRALETYVSEYKGTIFNSRSFRLLLDRNQRSLELKYADCTPQIPAEDRAKWNALREALILKRRTDCPPIGLKSAAVYWLFLHCPKVAPALRTAYRFCKGFLRRTAYT